MWRKSYSALSLSIIFKLCTLLLNYDISVEITTKVFIIAHYDLDEKIVDYKKTFSLQTDANNYFLPLLMCFVY